MWPTMLAQASARYPRAGAWSIGLMGSAGALSIQFVLPAIGAVYDRAKLEAAGGEKLKEAACASHRNFDGFPSRNIKPVIGPSTNCTIGSGGSA